MFVSCRKNVAVSDFLATIFGENKLFRIFLDFSPVLGGETSLGSEESQKHVFCPQNVDFWWKREILSRPTGMLGRACGRQNISPCPLPRPAQKWQKIEKNFKIICFRQKSVAKKCSRATFFSAAFENITFFAENRLFEWQSGGKNLCLGYPGAEGALATQNW